MSIGAKISVIALGAILAFATHVHTPGLDIAVIGIILIAVGTVALVMQLASLARQRELTAAHAAPGRAVVVRPNGAVPGGARHDDAVDRDGGI